MNQPAKQLLSMMLILLLGFSPLQSVIADMTVPFEQNNTPCHTPTASEDTIQHNQKTTHDCEMCSSDTVCNDADCSFSHCTSTGPALLQGFSLPVQNLSSLLINQPDQDTTPQRLPILLRPPRV